MPSHEFEQLQNLKQRFGYMFQTPLLGLDFYRGWLSDFISACEEIDAALGDDKRGFHFTQAKEKYGSARYYFSTNAVSPLRLSISDPNGLLELTTGLKDEHDVEKRIAIILHAAEKQSLHKCILCGATGKVRRFGGWLACACEVHGADQSGDALRSAVVRR
ncbi:MAG: hypothetical protein KKC79_19370 [Gammaproteobacteria bacterium]|nr:hypothetical protein [Gammaproteobacteria bacterium]MBU1443915.1 hypothetical protein [Gammaproteobacteria bacterium]MBU2285789.1 hypothetical protein [Gammaproteobacteria bacterium]MBU2410799.1 hypothetical protein [Gammaproteobacteria bacterium]